MDLQTVTSFFLWCTIINGGLFLFWTLCCKFIPDLVYRTQQAFFPLPKDSIATIMYGFLALFKIFFIMFNLVPLIALLILR